MPRIDYETLGKLIDVDEKDLEFERVTNSIDVVDREYGVEVIFDYYRRHGFPHYQIREEEKHDHLKKLRKFDVDTIFKDNQIVQTNYWIKIVLDLPSTLLGSEDVGAQKKITDGNILG